MCASIKSQHIDLTSPCPNHALIYLPLLDQISYDLTKKALKKKSSSFSSAPSLFVERMVHQARHHQPGLVVASR